MGISLYYTLTNNILETIPFIWPVLQPAWASVKIDSTWTNHKNRSAMLSASWEGVGVELTLVLDCVKVGKEVEVWLVVKLEVV